MVRYFLLALLLVLRFVGIPGFLADGPYWQRALLYSFFHANWWHIAVNGLAVWLTYKSCKPRRDLLIPFIIAVAVYPLSFKPVIGFSNVLYATMGMRTPPLNHPWWRQPPVITFLIITVALALVPRFSATTHIAAFLLGMAGAAISRMMQSR